MNWTLLLILFCTLSAREAAAQPIVLTPGAEINGRDIWAESEYHLEDGRWRSTAGVPSSVSYGHGALWMRTTFSNPTGERLYLILDHPYTPTDAISVQVLQKNMILQTMVAGDHVESEGDVAHTRNPVFELRLPPGESTLLIRVKSSTLISGRFDLWTPMAHFNKVNRELVFIAVMLGGLCILVFYNLFLYFSLRSRIYLHYVAYLVAFLNSQIIFCGVSRIFIHHAYPAVVLYWNEGLPIAIKLAWGFALSFAAQFLNLATYRPKLHRIVRGYMYLIFASVFSILVLPHRIDTGLTVALTVCSSIFLLSLGIWSSLRGYRPAFYYTAGWAVLLVATSVVALQISGFLPINLFTTWAQIVGAAIEGLVLSLALGERYNYMQNRAAAERENFIRSLMEKEASKAHSYSQLEKIVYPHQLELIKTGIDLEQTMPTGQSEACVISFDTISSSRLDRQKARAFLGGTFALCYRDMLAGYDQKKLQASAYRLKEVGDGFFCSVGFPFQTPEGENPAELALKLALRFSRNFHGEAQKHGFLHLPQASIAITFGEVEAYYASAGVVEYNLFGRGIILADRYEKLRKGALRGMLFTGNLLVIDQRIYDMLGETSRKIFQRFDIDAVQQTIRDDEQAHCFYFTELRHDAVKALPVSA